MAARGKGDEALEPRFADFHVAGRGGKHPTAVDEESFGGVGANRDLAGDGDPRAVENALADLDPVRIFRVKAAATLQVEQPGLEPPFLVGQAAAAGRELEILEPELVNRSRALIDQFADRARRGHRIITRRRAEAIGIGVGPDPRDLLFLADDDRLDRALEHDNHIGRTLGHAAAGIEDRPEQ